MPKATELLERLKANPRFVEAKPGAAVVIVGGQPSRSSEKPQAPDDAPHFEGDDRS